MSRYTSELGKDIQLHSGSDQVLGGFFDITDKRYADSDKDEQGEGYVVEWSQAFKFSTNLIGINRNELGDPSRIKELCNKFIETIK